MTRSPVYRLVYQGVHTSAFFGLKVVSSLLAVYVLARNLDPAEYGVFSLVKGLVTAGVYVLGGEFYSYAQRHVPGTSRAEGLALFMRVFSWEALAATLVVSLLVLSGADRGAAALLGIAGHADVYRLGFAILLGTLAVREFFRLFLALRMIEYSNTMMFLSGNLWVFLVAAWWAAAGSVDLDTALGTWLACTVGALGYVAWAVRREFGLSRAVAACLKALRSPSRKFLAAVVRFAGPVFASTVAVRLIGASDVYALSLLHGPDTAGVFGFYAGLLNVSLVMFVLIVSDVLTPYATARFNRQAEAEGWRLLGQIVKYSLIVFVLLASLMLLVADPLVTVLARVEYARGRALVPYLLVIALLNVLYLCAAQVLFLQSRTGDMARIGLAGLAINLGANALLVPPLAMIGAALAAIVSWSALLCMTCWSIGAEGLRRLGVTGLPRVVASGALALGLAPALRELAGPEGGLGWACGGGALLVLAYVASLLAFKAVGWEDVRALRTAIG